MIVDLALSVTGSQLIASVLPNVRTTYSPENLLLNARYRLIKTNVLSSTIRSVDTS